MSDFSVSTDDIDLSDFTSSRSQSPASMMPLPLPSSTSPPSIISEPGEKEMVSSTILISREDNVEDFALEHPIVNPDVTIDSFLPLFEVLESPGLQLIEGKYHLRGFISKDSFKKLSDSARSVTKFVLNDAHSAIDAGVFLRLVQLGARYNKSDALFSSLKSLYINVNSSDTSLSLLPLFLLVNLEVLEIEHVPESQLNTFLTFLDTLADEAPHLLNLTLGHGLSYNALHPACLRFINLRELNLSNMGPTLNWTTLQEIGQLPELETLVLDAGAVSYKSHLASLLAHSAGSIEPPRVFDLPGNKYDDQHTAPDPPSRGDNFGHPEQAEPSIFAVPSRVPSPSPSLVNTNEPGSFDFLAEPLSMEPEEPSAPSPKVSFNKLKTLHVMAEVDLMSELIDFITSSKMVNISLTLNPSSVLPKSNIIKKRPKGKLTPSEAAEAAEAATAAAAAAAAAAAVAATRFQEILQRVLEFWTHSLMTVRICRRKKYPDEPHSELEPSTFRSLLSHSSLRHLEISGWTVASDFGDALHHLSTLAQPSSLETLHLPLDLGAKGISLNRLRGIFESCPSLTSFQCGFKHISNVPPIPEDGSMFGAKTLGVGNPVAHADRRRLMDIALYLDALFPKLENITTQEGCNAQQWQDIYELVQMCQLSRSHHRRYAEKV